MHADTELSRDVANGLAVDVRVGDELAGRVLVVVARADRLTFLRTLGCGDGQGRGRRPGDRRFGAVETAFGDGVDHDGLASGVRLDGDRRGRTIAFRQIERDVDIARLGDVRVQVGTVDEQHEHPILRRVNPTDVEVERARARLAVGGDRASDLEITPLAADVDRRCGVGGACHRCTNDCACRSERKGSDRSDNSPADAHLLGGIHLVPLHAASLGCD